MKRKNRRSLLLLAAYLVTVAVSLPLVSGRNEHLLLVALSTITFLGGLYISIQADEHSGQSPSLH